MPADPDEQAFLAAIAADRGDLGLRGVFADWLDEHGRHEEADYQRRWDDSVRWAEDWLAEFGHGCDIPYPDLITAGHAWLRDETDYIQDWNLNASNDLCDDERRAEFWRAWRLVTGIDPKIDVADALRSHPFSCDCGGYDDLTPQAENVLPVGVARRGG